MTTCSSGSGDRAGWRLRADRLPAPAVVVALVLLAATAVTRAPYVLVHGRFWAEEGGVYFRHMATTSGPFELLWVQGRAGYLNLFANGSTKVASLVPLLRAPLVTAWLSLGVVLVTAWVALSWPSLLLTTVGARLAAAALLVVGTLAVPEVWLNSINAQTYLGILAVLLLFVPVEQLDRPRFVLGAGMLLLAGCSGLYAAVLAPLYVLNVRERPSARRWVYAGVITGALIVQAVSYSSAALGGRLNEKRALPDLADSVTSIFGRHVVGLLLGNRANQLASSASSGSAAAIALTGLLAVAFVGLLVLLLWRVPTRRVPALLLGALALTELLVLFGSFGGVAGGRYSVVPIAVLGLLLVHAATVSTERRLAPVAAVLIVVVLVMGLSQFWTASPETLRCVRCPQWSAEVQRWELGSTGELRIWPYAHRAVWVLKLPIRQP